MNRNVLDASALLAVLCGEPDAEAVAELCLESLLSVVNLAEVYSKTKDAGISEGEIDWAVEQLQIHVVNSDQGHARIIGSLREATREAGLSLGDRACLALGLLHDSTVVTSDENFTKPRLDVDVKLFRCRQPI
jgi:PIN domain nuclease of toxin-antitoxin system